MPLPRDRLAPRLCLPFLLVCVALLFRQVAATPLSAQALPHPRSPSSSSTTTPLQCTLKAMTLPTTSSAYVFGSRVLSPQCADGSPYIYFIRDASTCGGPPRNTSLWVLHLGGGAFFCRTDADCAQGMAKNKYLFSSTTLPSSMKGYDILDSDPSLNPTFADGTHVWLPYCSQDLWAGGAAAGSISNSKSVVFRGEDNMLAAWQALGISTAVVVLSGSSAGGLGAMRLAHYLAMSGTLAATAVQLRLLLDSAWFINFSAGLDKTFASVQQTPLRFFSVPTATDPITAALCNGSALTHVSAASPTIVPCCLESQCMVHMLFNSSGSALRTQGVLDGMLITSKYDYLSLALSGQLSSAVSGSFLSINTLLGDYGGEVLNSLGPLRTYTAVGGLALFSPPCIGHVWLQPEPEQTPLLTNLGFLSVSPTANMWATLQAGSTTLQRAVDAWWRGKAAHHVVSCYGASCDRSCPSIIKLPVLGAWDDPFAITLLVVMVLPLLLCILAFLVVRVKARRFRALIGWTRRGFVPAPSAAEPGLGSASGGRPRVLPTRYPTAETVRLSCTNLSYVPAKGARHLLQDVCVEVEPGELVAVMGSSGCGKSTLLDVLSLRKANGLITGTVFLNDVPATLMDPLKVRQCIAYVRQTGGCYIPSLTVFDNLMYVSLLRLPGTVSPEERKQHVLELAAEVGLDEVLNTPAGSEDSFAGLVGISGGQRRRLAIAIELINSPKVLLLDEPTSGLDATSSLQILRMLSLLTSKGCTVLLSIHQPRLEIFKMFDKVLAMHRGCVIVCDAPQKVVAVFLESNLELSDREMVNSSTNVADTLMDLICERQSPVIPLVKVKYAHSLAYSLLMDRSAALLKSAEVAGTPEGWQGIVDRCSRGSANPQAQAVPLVKWAQGVASKARSSARSFAHRLWVSIDRNNAGIGGVLHITLGQLVAGVLVYGLLFLNVQQSYVLSSTLFCVLTILPTCFGVAIAGKMKDDIAVLRKDLDVRAVSPLIFCISNFVTYTFWLVLPLVAASTLVLGLVVQDLLTFERWVEIIAVVIGNGVAVILLVLALGTLSHFQLKITTTVAHSAFFISLMAFFGLTSGFYISRDDAPWVVRWCFYLSPLNFSITSSMRELLTGLPSGCDPLAPFSDYTFCELQSPESFLTSRGIGGVNVGVLLVGIAVWWVVLFALFHFSIALDIGALWQRLTALVCLPCRRPASGTAVQPPSAGLLDGQRSSRPDSPASAARAPSKQYLTTVAAYDGTEDVVAAPSGKGARHVARLQLRGIPGFVPIVRRMLPHERWQAALAKMRAQQRAQFQTTTDSPASVAGCEPPRLSAQPALLANTVLALVQRIRNRKMHIDDVARRCNQDLLRRQSVRYKIFHTRPARHVVEGEVAAVSDHGGKGGEGGAPVVAADHGASADHAPAMAHSAAEAGSGTPGTRARAAVTFAADGDEPLSGLESSV